MDDQDRPRREPTGFLRSAHAQLRPAVGELARTAAGLGRWSARRSPARLASAVGALETEIIPWLAAEQRLVYPVAERHLGGAIAVAALRHSYLDLRRRADALAALSARLQDRPPTAAELDALRAGLYGLWATVSQHLSMEEATLFAGLDEACGPGELEALAPELGAVAPRLATEAGTARRG
jgi:iron-sulfur cluster repair protein YtfE (RIC family)